MKIDTKKTCVVTFSEDEVWEMIVLRARGEIVKEVGGAVSLDKTRITRFKGSEGAHNTDGATPSLTFNVRYEV